MATVYKRSLSRGVLCARFRSRMIFPVGYVTMQLLQACPRRRGCDVRVNQHISEALKDFATRFIPEISKDRFSNAPPAKERPLI